MNSEKSKRMVLDSTELETTFLGARSTRHGSQDAGIDDQYRRMHTLTVGPTGEGKTEVMKNAILQDIAKGHGAGIIVPKGGLIKDILANMPEERLDDVVYINPATSNPDLNPLQPTATEDMPDHVITNQKEIIVSELIQLFRRRSENWGDRFGRLLAGLLRACIDLNIQRGADYNLMDVYRCVVDGSERQALIDKIKNPVLRNSVTELDDLTSKELDPLRRRLEDFTANDIIRGIVSADESAVDFRQAIDNQRIILVEVQKGEIGLNPASLIAGIVLTKLWTAAQTRITTPEATRKPFYLYIDEFQNFSAENSVLTTILAEGREYRIGAWLTTQYLQRLDPGLREAAVTNCRNKIVFKPEGKDINTLASSLNRVDKDQLELLGEYQAVLQTPSSEDRQSAKIIETYPPWPPIRDPSTVETLKQKHAVAGSREEISVDVTTKTGDTVTAGSDIHDALLSVAETRLESLDAEYVDILGQSDGMEKPDGRVLFENGEKAFIEAEHANLSMPGNVLKNLKRAVDAGMECIFVVEEDSRDRLEAILENPTTEDGEYYRTRGGGEFTDIEAIEDAEYRILEVSTEELDSYVESIEEECPKLGDKSKDELRHQCIARTENGHCMELGKPCVLIEHE